MVSDQEPRYRLVDDEGNIVGSLYGKPDGTLALQEGTSGADNEAALGTDGTLSVLGLETETVTTDGLAINDVYAVAEDSEELSDLIDSVPAGQKIALRSDVTYEIDEIDKAVYLVGNATNAHRVAETQLGADSEDEITVSDRAIVDGLLIRDDIEIVEERVDIIRCHSGFDSEISIQADRCTIALGSGINATFESGTADGIAIGNRESEIDDPDDNNTVVGNS